MRYPTQILVSEAIHLIQERTPGISSERVPLLAAYGRVLAEDVSSLVDHPSHDNSALDGYACRAEDTLAATQDAPVRLELVADIPAGSVFEGEVEPCQAVGIYTGAPIPTGANAIIRVEDTSEENGKVMLYAPANKGDIRPLGQDFKRGETHLRRGMRLNAASVGVAAAMGHAELSVARKLKVGILATGDEVIAPGEPLRAGQVYNSNTFAVAGLVRAAGAEPIVLEHVQDDQNALAKAVANSGQLDLLLTSGGVSMGKYDFVRDLLFERGEVAFWKVAQKPAGPVLFGHWRDLPVLGLPGNPVSSMVAFIILARAFIDKAMGASGPLPYHQRQQAVAGTPLKSAGFKETFARVKLEAANGSLRALSTGSQNSGILTSMTSADALAIIPPHTQYAEGDGLEVIPLAGLL